MEETLRQLLVQLSKLTIATEDDSCWKGGVYASHLHLVEL